MAIDREPPDTPFLASHVPPVGTGGDDGTGIAAGTGAARKRRRPEPTPVQRALGLLVRREHSRKELSRKLAARGVPPDEAGAAIDKLAADGWQDDARFAELLDRKSVV